MSFSSTAKRRLPWLDVSRIVQQEAASTGARYEDAMAELVITLFEELSRQSRVSLAVREDGATSAALLPRANPLLGPGDQ